MNQPRSDRDNHITFKDPDLTTRIGQRLKTNVQHFANVVSGLDERRTGLVALATVVTLGTSAIIGSAAGVIAHRQPSPEQLQYEENIKRAVTDDGFTILEGSKFGDAPAAGDEVGSLTVKLNVQMGRCPLEGVTVSLDYSGTNALDATNYILPSSMAWMGQTNAVSNFADMQAHPPTQMVFDGCL